MGVLSKRRVQAKPAEHTIIIFDWDDTLLPTSWLAAELGNDVQLWPARLGQRRLGEGARVGCQAPEVKHVYLVSLEEMSRL